MADEEGREPASDPQDLERLLVCRQRAGDFNGIVALYGPGAGHPHGLGRLRMQWPAPIMELPAYAIGCMAAFWFVERVRSVLSGAS
jgi:hypothetical protein